MTDQPVASASRRLGVVAAGNPFTARAGARILEEGGNAVDAAVAAAFASMVSEPMLTDLGGGGYLMVGAPGAPPRIYDFFVCAPGLEAPPGIVQEVDFSPVVLDFGDTTQVFHCGLGAAAVPGNVHGLCTAHAAEGRLPLSQVVAPAVELGRQGVPLTEQMAAILSIIAPIFRLTPGLARLVAPDGPLLRAGERLVHAEAADLIEAIGADGHRAFYEGDVARAIARSCQEGGGLITEADLREYRTVVRAPIQSGLGRAKVWLNGAPSTGGALIALGMALAEAAELTRDPLDPAWLVRLATVMEVTSAARAEVMDRALLESGYTHDMLGEPEAIAEYTARIRARLGLGVAGVVPPPAGAQSRGSTTHLSVIDKDGLAASVTTSNGEGSGSLVPGTGVHLNNMLGEEDLNPGGFHRYPPGRRLPSMMCPTLVERANGTRIALGSGGSNRIRTAILQVCLRLVRSEQTVSEAVCAPRIHFERDVIEAEPGFSAEALAALERDGYSVRRWRAQNLFFGGAHTVSLDGSGHFDGQGDERRGGSVAFAEGPASR
jgi:gamma-glutamyltranspeptidase/glutathione hydrolase